MTPIGRKKQWKAKEDEIRTCSKLLELFRVIALNGLLTWPVNPCIGRKEFANLEKNGEGRQVVVIGSGPGGIEAAGFIFKRV